MIRRVLALPSWTRLRPDLLVVLGIATALRVGVFVAAVRSPQRFWSQDARDYIGVATHLHASYLSGSGRWFEVGLLRPPVYPLFIRLVFDIFGRHYAPIIAIQLGISVATVGLVYWLAQLLLPRRYALGAAFLLAIDPASIVFANQMLTETLFAFLLTIAIVLVVVGQRRGGPVFMLAAGLMLGFATLTRPVAEYLPLLLVPALVLPAATRRRASLALAAALAAGFVLPVGGWVIRNFSQTHVPIVSTIDGHNMLDYRAVGALVESGELPWDARKHVAVQLAARVHPGQNAAEVSRVQMRLGLDIIGRHPVGATKSWLKGEGRLLGGTARPRPRSFSPAAKAPLELRFGR